MLREQAISGKVQPAEIQAIFILASAIIYVLSISIFFTFTKALRHFLKYIAVFEKENESLYSIETTIRPTTQIFHMQRPEIKSRFFLSKMLTFTVVVIFAILAYKYGMEVYRLLCSEHVSFQVEMGQSAVDDILLGLMFFFFITLIYTSMAFQVDESKGRNKYRGYAMRYGLQSNEYGQSLIERKTYYTIDEGGETSKTRYHTPVLTPKGFNKSPNIGGNGQARNNVFQYLNRKSSQRSRNKSEKTARSQLVQENLTTETSEESSEIDVNRYGTYFHMIYEGRNFYANREHHSATSSE